MKARLARSRRHQLSEGCRVRRPYSLRTTRRCASRAPASIPFVYFFMYFQFHFFVRSLVRVRASSRRRSVVRARREVRRRVCASIGFAEARRNSPIGTFARVSRFMTRHVWGENTHEISQRWFLRFLKIPVGISRLVPHPLLYRVVNRQTRAEIPIGEFKNMKFHEKHVHFFGIVCAERRPRAS